MTSDETVKPPRDSSASNDRSPPYTHTSQGTSLCIPTRGIEDLPARLSYQQVINLIPEALKSACIAVKEEQLDASSIPWNLSYQDLPPEDIRNWASKELQRYMNHLADAMELWNRGRVLYLSDRALAGKQKVSDPRVFGRNDVVWLRNSSSCEVALDSLSKIKEDGVELR